jgi:type II secretory pathway pseudopilin PulG
MKHVTRSDSGETLLEMVISIAILGVCVVGIGAGMAIGSKTASIQSAQASASASLHNDAEALQGTYATCSGLTPPNYVSIEGLTAPSSNFNGPTATIVFWNATSGAFDTSTCPEPGKDPGLQQVTLSLATKDGLVAESLIVILRAQS